MIVKLKRQLSFRRHVSFEGVCPESINQSLLYLKKYNPLCQDITINMNNIPDNLKDLTDQQLTIFMNFLIWRKMLTFNLIISVVHRNVLIPNTPSVEEINFEPGKEKKKIHYQLMKIVKLLLFHTCFQQVNIAIQLRGI